MVFVRPLEMLRIQQLPGCFPREGVSYMERWRDQVGVLWSAKCFWRLSWPYCSSFRCQAKYNFRKHSRFLERQVVSWLHTPLPWVCSLQSWHKDTYFWCKHCKLAFTQNSHAAVVHCLSAMGLRTGWCITDQFADTGSCLRTLMLIREVNFQSENESLMSLHIHMFPYSCIRLQIWSKPLQCSW